MAHHLLKEEIKDTRGVIRIHKSKNDRQHDDKKINDKRTNNDLHIKIKIEKCLLTLNTCKHVCCKLLEIQYKSYK